MGTQFSPLMWVAFLGILAVTFVNLVFDLHWAFWLLAAPFGVLMGQASSKRDATTTD